MTLTAEVVAAVDAFQNDSDRSKQTATGASQNDECRAASILRLREVPVTDRRIGWQAFVGSAIDSLLGQVRLAQRPDLLVQKRVTYKGIPCTIDEYDPAAQKVSDWKSKDDAAKVEQVRRYGPSVGQEGQVHLNAAAMIEASYPVTTVCLMFVPRAGEFEAYEWEAPFDRAKADEAAARIKERDRLAADPDVDHRDYRDKPAYWCAAYCDRITACRGAYEGPTEVDPDAVLAASEFLTAKADKEVAESRMADARQVLDTYHETGIDLKAVGLRYQGGNVKTETVPDLTAVQATLAGLGLPMPMKEQTKFTAVQLRKATR